MLLIILFLISGCSNIYDKYNPNPKPINEKFFNDIYEPEEDIPVYRDYTIKKKPVKNISKKFYKKVSLTLTKDTDVKDALRKIADKIGINIRISNNVTETITFTARKEEFIEVIKDLADILGLVYKIKNDKIYIYKDENCFKTYDVHFLNLSREINSSIATTSNVLSSDEQNQQNEIEHNGSSSVVSSNSVNNFWSELESNISAMIGNTGTFTIHKQAGLISINTTHHVHKKIKKYLDKLKEACSSQVMIEAKILEVSLNKEFRTGINWLSLKKNLVVGIPTGSSINKSSAFDINQGSSDLFTIGARGRSLETILHFIEKFGSIRTLSNPRITIMNNQTGILKVARQEVYFNLRYDNRYQNTITGNNRESIYSNIKTVPVGLVFSVHPVINMHDGTVTLTIRPTISRISEYKDDPSVAFMESAKINNTNNKELVVGNKVPVIEVREMDSVMTVKSGDVVVLGGLMSESAIESYSGAPLTNRLLISDLTNSKQKENKITEIVIFIRVRILNDINYIHKKDKSVYNKFVADNRPIKFIDNKNATKKL